MFNEVIVVFVLYTIICLTPFVEDVLVKFKVGFVLYAILMIYFVLHSVIIVKGTIRGIRFNCLILRGKKHMLKE